MSGHKGPNSQSEGSRAGQLLKKRQAEKDEMAAKKIQIAKDQERSAASIDVKFSSKVVEGQNGVKYGLMTLKDLRESRKDFEEAKAAKIKAMLNPAYQDPSKKKKKKKKQKKATLSFDQDEEEDDGDGGSGGGGGNFVSKGSSSSGGSGGGGGGGGSAEAPPLKKAKTMKNPEVDTSFLPDRDREFKEKMDREKLRTEWSAKQQTIKDEVVAITYSYWDGTGHRRTIKMKKGDTIEAFLQGCLGDLRKEFHELRGVTSEGLIYIKEDLIIPSNKTFYDFIVTKARGKSGPLFDFGVNDDVRLLGGANVETEESHAGKVILRSWYDRNKHIYPANRWEIHDPDKDYGNYTIGDSTKNGFT